MEKVLWISNLITLVLLILLGWYFKVPQHVYGKLFKKQEIPPTFVKVERDTNEMKCAYNLKFYDFHYKKETDAPSIVMLGDSHIRNGEWTQLLNRDDIINRGISGDNTECICERLDYLKEKNAKIWFIEGGINDLPWQTPAFVLENYKTMVDFVKSEHAIPVINLVLYSSPLAGINYPTRSDYKRINSMVKELNTMLMAYATANNIDYIDLNTVTADSNDVFKDEYTTDGIHLTDEAYKAWAAKIEKILEKYKI